ncbi:unnamed protein product [Ectocarpus sp. CCAP 1310/34]|nr:unnamed protein product [Ectocarpus sp. CCAP 1310/34]
MFSETITITAGDDFEASCLKVVEPGDTCHLEKGDYVHDGLTVTHGTEDKRITITGDPDACIKGSNTQDRVMQIAHDYYTIEGICFDGHHGDENVATAIYVLGADRKSTKNGETSSVTGLEMFDLEIKNFSSECVHFRYFVTHAEVSGCTIQVKDGKAPEPKLRTGSADNVDADVCGYNWIHHNTFRTYGNECVDIKEGSANNLVEHNVCEQQVDPNSGCFGSRGSDNTFRWNEIAECKGAGIRVGGEDGYGEGNHMYGNTIKNAEKGAFNVMSPNQGTVCENSISGIDLIVYGSSRQYALHNRNLLLLSPSTLLTLPMPLVCSRSVLRTTRSSSARRWLPGSAQGRWLAPVAYPGDIGTGSSAPAPAPEEGDEVDAPLDDNGLEAGVNFTNDAKDSEPEIDVIETNESAGLTGLGSCSTVVEVKQANLLDGTTETYFSVHREGTAITLELQEETEVNGVAIGFFMKAAEAERIQVFDISVMEEGGDDWKTVISRKESSGAMGDVQTFSFSSRKALYVRLETHGKKKKNFNNWTAFTEVEVCAKSAETNALFGGIEAIREELGMLAGEVCSAPTKLVPTGAKASRSDDVRVLFDGNYETWWSTINTQSESDLSNDMVQLTFAGDTRVSFLNIAFFDGHLAHQYFFVYVQSAHAYTWTPVMLNEQAATQVGMQTFSIDLDGVHKIYVVGKGNDVGAYSKLSEVEVYGC